MITWTCGTVSISWNSVNMGRKKDILAGWEKAARKYGLYFGVSLHADHAWSWYEPSQRHDTKGPKKRNSYDGKLTKQTEKENGGKDMIRRICMHRTIH